jgi:hypothetical protein
MIESEALYTDPEERTKAIHYIAYEMKKLDWRVDAGIPRSEEEADRWNDLTRQLLRLLQERADDLNDESRNYQSVSGIDY